MAISHSNHLFVPLAFVFCLLSSVARVSDSYGERTILLFRTMYDFIFDEKKGGKKRRKQSISLLYLVIRGRDGGTAFLHDRNTKRCCEIAWRRSDVDDTRDNNTLSDILIREKSRDLKHNVLPVRRLF